jgi:AraC family transcriptional regulator of adaptative response/methylated-DNA-[protein]-cysteine methyltransferase
MTELSHDFQRISRAIEFLENNVTRQPSLKEVASTVHLSEFHFQRLFQRWAGISPKKFLQFLTIEHAKKLLEGSRSILDVSYETGLSSTSRLHDLFVSVEALTPGEFKERGQGLTISYGVHASPFGECMLAVTERGICRFKFLGKGDAEREVKMLKKEWPNAKVVQKPAVTEPYLRKVFAGTHGASESLSVLLKGTNFQIKVWEALLRIPRGTAVSYEDLAKLIGQPSATRAVASAVAQNPVVFLIPCHRVIRKMGIFGDYQGGSARKKAILVWEYAKVS